MDINLLSANTICYSIIAEHISTRHWIADYRSEIGSYMFACLYVYPMRFWNVSKAQCMHERDSNSICTANMQYLCACVCMHTLQFKYLDYNTSKVK